MLSEDLRRVLPITVSSLVGQQPMAVFISVTLHAVFLLGISASGLIVFSASVRGSRAQCPASHLPTVYVVYQTLQQAPLGSQS